MKKQLLRLFTGSARLAARLASDERGQSTTEYILILAVVVMIAMKFKTTFNTQLTGLLTNLNGQMSSFSDTSGQ
jgi:Flp pilus assembly pilin Flp